MLMHMECFVTYLLYIRLPKIPLQLIVKLSLKYSCGQNNNDDDDDDILYLK